jgi:hypothetical protein
VQLHPAASAPAVESRLFAPFRRLGQRALYKWYWMQDEL